MAARGFQLADESSPAKRHDVTMGVYPDKSSAVRRDPPRRAACGLHSETIAEFPGNGSPHRVTANSAQARPDQPYTRLGPSHGHPDRDLPRETAIDPLPLPRVRRPAANRRSKP